MNKKPTFEELEQKVRQLEKENTALRKSTERLKLLSSITENMSDSVLATNANFKITYLNKKAEELFGYRLDELLGQTPDIFNAEPTADEIQSRLYETVSSGNVYLGEYLNKRKNGTKFLCEFKVFPLFADNGEISTYVGIQRDITERKKAEEALRLYIMSLDQIEDRVIIADLDWHIMYANNAACKLINKTADELFGQHATIFGKESTTGISQKEIIRQTLEKGSWRGEVTSISLDGSARIMYLRTLAVKDKKGQIVALCGVSTDITERNQMQEQLQQSQKMDTIGTLAGGIAHEFNNILGGIFGFLDIAREDVPVNSPVQESLDEIHRLGMRARNVVKQILAFSRKDHQKKRPIQLSLVLKEELKMLRATIPATIEIRHHLDASCGPIMGDPMQIQQVIMNLCVNAKDAMEKKGGVLDISLSPVVLDMADIRSHPDLPPGEYAKLSVSDTGNGIAPEIMDKIFDPFFTTKDVGKGTGMGLSVVHGIIKDHGGTITVSSEPGEGTTFTVLFRVTDAEGTTKAEEKSLPTGTENILLVDDEDFIIFPQKKILEKLGYKVTAMTGSLETLALFSKNPQRYDLIITDLTMPNLTGDRLAAEVTAIRPDMPVILTTGYADSVDSENVKQSGIKAFISKPFQREALAKTIRLVLDA